MKLSGEHKHSFPVTTAALRENSNSQAGKQVPLRTKNKSWWEITLQDIETLAAVMMQVPLAIRRRGLLGEAVHGPGVPKRKTDTYTS